MTERHLITCPRCGEQIEPAELRFANLPENIVIAYVESEKRCVAFEFIPQTELKETNG